MHRLLQGEVGSGKTVVALLAMLQVVDAGGQAALLAPTEVLAHQHARSIDALLGPLARAGQLDGAEQATRVALLTGSLPAPARKAALLDVASGAAGIVIGTHALIQEHVQFAELGLVVVDEQHRFGVEQRDALRGKAASPPHLLVMTATPIPRTVAMTVFGDLETSTLAELPAGRAPILTSVVPTADKPAWLERAWQRIREEVAAGHQAYIVCPRIGSDSAEPDEGDAPLDDPAEPARRPPLAVTDVLPMLAEGPLAGLEDRPATRQSYARRKRSEYYLIRGRAFRRARLEQGHRSWGGRPERHRDGGPGRGPIRRLPAAPAARPDRARKQPRHLPADHRSSRGGTVPGTPGRGRGDHRRLRTRPPRRRAAPRG